MTLCTKCEFSCYINHNSGCPKRARFVNNAKIANLILPAVFVGQCSKRWRMRLGSWSAKGTTYNCSLDSLVNGSLFAIGLGLVCQENLGVIELGVRMVQLICSCLVILILHRTILVVSTR